MMKMEILFWRVNMNSNNPKCNDVYYCRKCDKISCDGCYYNYDNGTTMGKIHRNNFYLGGVYGKNSFVRR